MRRILFVIFLFSAIVVAFYSCRKDPKPSGQDQEFSPTPIDPKTIFPAKLGMPALPKDNPLTVEGVYLGRLLFYDPILSVDSTISCASCHFQQNAFSDPAKVSTGVFGLKTGRNAQALFNLAYSKVFFWDARQTTLRRQAFEPIQAHNEMGSSLPDVEDKLQRSALYKTWFKKAFNASPNVMDMSLALEQFMLTIVSADSKYQKFFPANFSILTQQEIDGAVLFQGFIENGGADCSHCHDGILLQKNNPNGEGIANNGLDLDFNDKGYGGITGISSDIGAFKTPSLLNIAVTAPYMHDGRFSTLEQVIDHYSDSVKFNSPTLHPIMQKHAPNQRKLTLQEKANLKAFLLTTTDTVYLNNPAYANPFK